MPGGSSIAGPIAFCGSLAGLSYARPALRDCLNVCGVLSDCSRSWPVSSLQEGKGSRMNCRHHIAVLAVALFVSAAGVAFAATPYYLTDLGTPGYSSSANAVATMNGKPVIVGSGQVTSTSTVNACYWTPSGSGFALTDVGPRSKAHWVPLLIPAMSRSRFPIARASIPVDRSSGCIPA